MPIALALLCLILGALALGMLPCWPWTDGWGYVPASVPALGLVVIAVLLVRG